ncbi:MAG: ATP synthase F1 subunit delta [Acidobacteria bacterium]|nr:ATP synthase F1 subunit delta [Acidobacteriota bacterium]
MIRKSLLLKYARSLAEVAVESGFEPQIQQNFEHMTAVNRQVPEFLKVFKNPVIPLDVKRKLMTAVADTFGYHAYFRDFLKLLTDHHRTAYLPDIYELYLREQNTLTGILSVQVFAPRPLDEAHQRRLASELAEILGVRIQFDVEMDDTLIGGLKIRMDGTVYDGSVKRQLERFRESLSAEAIG